MTEFVDDINLDLAFNNVKPKDWFFCPLLGLIQDRI